MMLTKHQIRKKSKGLCVTPYCTKSAANNRNVCWSCKVEKYKNMNPEKYCFQTLRNNARRRGKEFSLTFDQFMMFLNENPEYMKKKGRGMKKLSIDRIDNNKGYSLENIRSITNAENIYKYQYQDKDPEAEGYVPF